MQFFPDTKMQHNRILGLFKFGKRNHMEELVREGHLFMSSLSKIIAMETDELRADKNEALSYILQSEGAELHMERDGQWMPIDSITGPFRFRKSESDSVNVFCMYAVRDTLVEPLVDQRNFRFGDAFVVFIDGDEFLCRVRAEAIKKGIEIVDDSIEYVDQASYTGPMGIFKKFSSFSYQSEFRIAIPNGNRQTFSLRVGNLSDIARIGNLHEINERIKLVPSEVSQQSSANNSASYSLAVSDWLRKLDVID